MELQAVELSLDQITMAKLKEGDKVRISSRKLTKADNENLKFFEHMQGLTGVVANFYNSNEVAVNIDLESMEGRPEKVHLEATKRMRNKFKENATQEQIKLLDKEELNFTPHYVLLVREDDLEKI